MAWIRVESSVARNRKFVKAGPAPSWLWLCGLAYCQEGLTDGFIPTEALEFLGVKNARRLSLYLVLAGLWDVVEGGWQVHDYLDHNRNASEVQRIRQERRDAGERGGVASGTARKTKQTTKQNLESAEANQQQTSKQPANPSTATDQLQLSTATATPTTQIASDAPPITAWLEELQAAYPPSAVTSGYLTETAFCDVVLSHGTPQATFMAMLCNLENQRAGYQWRVKRMIPRLDKWLREGLWRQEHSPEAPAAEQLTSKTNRTLAAASAILREQV